MPQDSTIAIAPHRSPLTDSDRAIIAQVLTWDTQRDITPDEIETLAITYDVAWIKLTGNRAIPIHVETFRAIRRQQLESVEQPQKSDVEIDCEDSSISTYRVWKGFSLLGTFHRSPVDGKWVTHPVFGRDYNRHETSDEAIAAIVRAWNAATEVRSLQGLEAA